MQTFDIVQTISSGTKRIGGRKVATTQAIVRFPDGDTARHLVMNGSVWQGWNSDSVLRARNGIIAAHDEHQSFAAAAQERISKIGSKIADLKGKRGVTESRKLLRDALKAAKATLAVANNDLAKVAAIAKKVDETHPEIVAFE